MATFKFTSKIQQVIKDIEVAEEKSLIESAILVQDSASKKARVDTGRLRASISYSVNGENSEGWSTVPESQPDDHDVKSGKSFAIVGTNVEYAPYLEYGTKRSKARPFLRPAYDESKATIKKIFKTNLGKVGK